MKRFAIGLACAFAAWVAGAAGGGFLVYLVSSNTHDRSLEAGMTGIFAIGPIAAIIGFIAGVSLSGRRGADPDRTLDPE